MTPYSDVNNWVSTIELTAAGLRRTHTGFPLGTFVGRPNRRQKYEKKSIDKFFSIFSVKNPSFDDDRGMYRAHGADSVCLYVYDTTLGNPPL
jgi:hypothetical protein